MTNKNNLQHPDEITITKPPAPVTSKALEENEKSAKIEKETLQAQNRSKNEEQETEQTPESTKRVRLRLIPVWLRLILVLLAIVGISILGLIIGYSVLGDGDSADVLKWETWQHIIDIIRGVEE